MDIRFNPSARTEFTTTPLKAQEVKTPTIDFKSIEADNSIDKLSGAEIKGALGLDLSPKREVIDPELAALAGVSPKASISANTAAGVATFAGSIADLETANRAEASMADFTRIFDQL